MGVDNRWFEVDPMNGQSLFSKQKIAKVFEDMLVVFIGSKVIVSNSKVHEWKDM